MRTGWTPTRTRTILCKRAAPCTALGVRRRSLPASRRGRRRIVLSRSSLLSAAARVPPPLSPRRLLPAEGQNLRATGAGDSSRATPSFRPRPRHNPGVASLTLFVATQENARLHQICALSGRHLQARRPGITPVRKTTAPPAKAASMRSGPEGPELTPGSSARATEPPSFNEVRARRPGIMPQGACPAR